MGAIAADLHEVYGIDLGDPATLDRSWRWLRSRIEHLLTMSPTWTPDRRPIMATRLGRALYPTEAPEGGEHGA